MEWKTITTYVDTETGEVLTKRHIEKGLYVKLNYTSTTKIQNNDKGLKQITWKCERNRQTKLEL